jgi:DNA-binding CsgD family transcriptional regulator
LSRIVVDPVYLTPQELRVLALALAGLPAKAMADQMAISPNTVNGHLKSIFRKLGVGSRATLIARFRAGADTMGEAPATARRAAELSPRERQTLDLLRIGLSAKGMADHLGISVHTVNQYTKSIFRKFGVGSRGALLALATTTTPKPLSAPAPPAITASAVRARGVG